MQNTKKFCNTLLVMGYQASGKSSYAHDIPGVYLNRDTVGGKVTSLLPMMQEALDMGKDVVLDNTFPTVESRAPFIELGKKYGYVDCFWVKTSLEDAQINALHRMWERYDRLFLDPDSIKNMNVKDPNMFPVAALFAYRNSFEKPTMAEGFNFIKSIPFVRKPKAGYNNSAVIFDYDGTLRDVPENAAYKFPTTPDDVRLMPNRKEKIKQLKESGILILGISNQSGIARDQVSEETVKKCFDVTNELLGADIDVVYCPHGVPPRCYCRKPQSGLGVLLIEKYKLDPSKCLYIGDQTTDKTFAKRLGFQYTDQSDYFKN